jgi:hypothetical protein
MRLWGSLAGLVQQLLQQVPRPPLLLLQSASAAVAPVQGDHGHFTIRSSGSSGVQGGGPAPPHAPPHSAQRPPGQAWDDADVAQLLSWPPQQPDPLLPSCLASDAALAAADPLLEVHQLLLYGAALLAPRPADHAKESQGDARRHVVVRLQDRAGMTAQLLHQRAEPLLWALAVRPCCGVIWERLAELYWHAIQVQAVHRSTYTAARCLHHQSMNAVMCLGF